MSAPAAPADSGNPLAGLSQWAGDNRYLLMGLASGLLGAPTIGQGLSRGFQNAAQNSLADDAIRQRGTAQKLAAVQQNQTLQWLQAQGMDPQQATVLAGNKEALSAFLKSKTGTGGEYGLNPIWGTDANGNPALIQLGKDGSPMQPKLPQGFNIARDPIKVDAGTETVLLDPQTRQPIGRISKNVQAEAQQKAVGTATGEVQGQAQANLPNVLATAQQIQKTIQDVRNDPYRDRGTGLSSIFNVIPATGGYDFARKVDQLKGQAFLQAFQSLKGGGAITEVEGQKATNALARLDTAQSKEAFNQALSDMEEVVNAGVERAKKLAAGGAPAAPGAQPSAPSAPAAPASSYWTTLDNGVKIRPKVQ
ncbi:hypothetical protein AZC_0850 [Azorhizobium caulinodans ORS 571]|uniref:Uncharacterized protein n=2 Tax=Azorhizobium caulinodans TaxID=7 RepID=A8HTL6_AZOC5|nr:hypothetical protein AZC_0850 [Azorhizobium caulinodans ORS 571]